MVLVEKRTLVGLVVCDVEDLEEVWAVLQPDRVVMQPEQVTHLVSDLPIIPVEASIIVEDHVGLGAPTPIEDTANCSRREVVIAIEKRYIRAG